MPTKLAPDSPRIAAVIQRIQELSSNGVAPIMATYHANRGDLPSVGTLHGQGWSWSDLCKLAGLIMNGRSERSDKNAVPPEVEAEIAAAFARGDHLPLHKREWPMQAIPTGKRERIVINSRTGQVVKVTTYSASIR